MGFINKLPHHLIEAFKATMEESASSDILLHVIDLSNPQMEKQIEVVDQLIEDFQWNDKPIIHVFNKIDVAPIQNRFKIKQTPRVLVSAHTGEGLDELRQIMTETIQKLTIPLELFFPLEKQHLVYDLQREAASIYKEESQLGCLCKVQIIPTLAKRWLEYRVSDRKNGEKTSK